MLGFKGLLAASAGLLLAGCIGDEFLVGAGGHDGAGGATTGTGVTGPGSSAASTGTDGATSTSSGSGGCTGCLADGVCQPGDAVDACGAAAAACQACETTALCQTPSCVGGACGTTPANDGDPCPFVPGDETSGQCVGGTCVEAPEDCLNGLDDDEDGDFDCLDADCNVAFTCVADTPEGWSGPVAVYEGAVACPGVWGVVVEGLYGRDLTVDGHTCACSATDASCSEISFTLDASPSETCADGTSPELLTLAADTCVDLDVVTTDDSFAHLAFVDCAGQLQGDPVLPAPTLGEVFTVCGTPVPEGGVGCDAAACRARVPDSGGAQGDICITRAGDETCPAPFTSKRVVSSFTDTRACDCTCRLDCGADIELFGASDCEACGGAGGAGGAGAGCTTLDVGAADCATDVPASASLHAQWSPEGDPVAEMPGPVGDLEGDELTICCLP